jgi:hypothetical protein
MSLRTGEGALTRRTEFAATLGQAEAAYRAALAEYQASPACAEARRALAAARTSLTALREEARAPGLPMLAWEAEAKAADRAEVSAYEARAAAAEARAALRAAETSRVLEPVLDAEGFDLRPDPLTARNPAELVAAMRQYREWAGKPSFRKMADRIRQTVAASTLCTALRGGDLPRLDVVLAVIAGCGGSTEDKRRFATAWRMLSVGLPGAKPAAAGPALQVVPPAAQAS